MKNDILALMRRLVTFPQATICVHAVACELLNILTTHGYDPPDELVVALVDRDDQTALKHI